MKKTNLIFSIVALAFTLVTIIPVLYAWYITADRVDNMEFNILQIDSLVTLYEANDSNCNGVPDLCDTGNENKYYNSENDSHISYQKQYYDEYYSFNYVDQRYALSQDSQANLLNTVTISDVVPSKIYGYKFEIINYVGLENTLAFSFLQDNNINVNILKDFDVRLGVVSSQSTIDFTDWTPFCTYSNEQYSYSGVSLNPYNDSITLDAFTGNLGVGRLDLWLQIRMNPNATNDNISNFVLPYYRLSLSCDMPEENS